MKSRRTGTALFGMFIMCIFEALKFKSWECSAFMLRLATCALECAIAYFFREKAMARGPNGR